MVLALREEESQRTGHKPTSSEVILTALKAFQASRMSDAQRAAVVVALLDFGKELWASETFTEDPRANELLSKNGFAFLLAVIFNQGIKAERVWAVPLELERRLGHLDPGRVASEKKAVAEAIKGPPSLHRYVKKMPVWVAAAADRVLRQYGGRAEAIWEDSPSAQELHRRFDEFEGIGQKKAAIAVEILEKRGVSVTQMDGSNVAYDVHVRRVFLRTGLALYNDPDHIIAVARQLNASRPGAIDLPTWSVGRNWCHPGPKPDCDHCQLREPCPKLIDRAITVRGA